jgi:CheY-like chemotaxis protein
MQPHLNQPIALLVDDDQTRRSLLKTRLEAFGVPSLAVPHVLPALSCLADNDAIRLVFIDEDVAEETGFRTLVRATRRNGRRLRTVLLLSDTARREKYVSSGVECYVGRPTDARGTAALLDLVQSRNDTPRDLARTG